MRVIKGMIWLFSLCTAAPLLDSASKLLAPAQDPWYTAPDGFEATAPGTVLRIRSAPGNVTTVIGNTAAAYNILYRTTDSRYQPSWAVTTVLVPTSFYVSPSGNKALLSYQLAYDSAALVSNPSSAFYYDLAQPSNGAPSTNDVISTFLSEGWLVSVPDYEGPTAAFGASVQAGHATLDSIRAVLSLAQTTNIGNMTVAMSGYSGGSIATEAAAELQVQYAPELNIRGTVLGGLVADFSTNFDLFNESPLAGDLVNLLIGVTTQYPEATAYLRSRLHPAKASEFFEATNMTTTQAIIFWENQDIYSYFQGGAADLQAEVLQRVFKLEMKLGYHGVPAMPLFVYKAIGDEYCPIGEADALVKKFCSVGAEITYERNTIGGHVAEIRNGQFRFTDWLRGIFNESYTPLASGCVTRDVTVDLSLV
ncbi:LIP-domain-containing protein [Hypoxylon fuscum]|nr:LIP-domain-containing protein [Hypoxylon fuscum]